MHYVNTNFGHLHVLAQYAGQPDRYIVGYVQHGWYEVGPLREEPQLPLIPKLLWNGRNVADAAAAGVRNIVPIGAPRLYLPDVPAVTAARGTIAYPYHSWDFDDDHPHGNIGVPRDEAYAWYHERYAAELSEREAGPVTVALYWRDFEERAAREPYEAKGMDVITHGGRTDPEFLARQRDAQLRHERAVTNRVGSALWYAAYSGLAVEAYGPFTGSSSAEARWFKAFQIKHFPHLFAAGGLRSQGARELASKELGSEYKRGPEELAEIVGWRGWRRRIAPAVELADRFQFRLRGPRHRRRLPPPFWEAGDGFFSAR